MNTRTVMSFFLGVSAVLLAYPRSVEKINSDWRFHKGEVEMGYRIDLDDSGWKSVDLPHTWNVDDSFDRRGVDDGLDIAFYYYRGAGWYRKSILLSKGDEHRRVFLNFEGANKVADVWVNEQHIGRHVGGYTGFGFDITSAVDSDRENLIAVRVDNSYNYDIPPHRADYTMYGGIYRDVYLIKTLSRYIGNVQISTPNVSLETAKVYVTIPVSNLSPDRFNGLLELSITDSRNQIVSVVKENVVISPESTHDFVINVEEISNPLLWAPDARNMYQAKIQLVNGNGVFDDITERFGLRWFSFDPDRGFFLNGKHLRLKGVNRHQDRAGYGNAVPDSLHIEDIQLVKSMGANFIRLAHYPQDPAVLSACDSLGLLVWEEIPVITSVGKEKFKENAKEMLREMIMQHYNHPSIIIWGLMNETVRHQPDDELHWTVDLCKELNELAHHIDPYRVTAQAQFDSRGTDILEVTDIRGWNRYFGWYRGKFGDFGTFMDEQKRQNPHHNFIISEYGAGSKRGYHIENPTEPDFSEEWQLAFHKNHWEQISDRPWIAGSCVWNMFDFASDEKGGNIPHINQKGLADFSRIPKDVFYFYQSIWTKKPMIYIVSHTWLERAGKKGESKRIEVFSNCDEVDLFVNKNSLGRRKSPFIWEVFFDEGRNDLQAVGKKGDITVDDQISLTYTFIE